MARGAPGAQAGMTARAAPPDRGPSAPPHREPWRAADGGEPVRGASVLAGILLLNAVVLVAGALLLRAGPAPPRHPVRAVTTPDLSAPDTVRRPAGAARAPG
ncbi:hypothetical protein AB0A94_21955 [Streptomyces sp. NPDC044984]|uniref:hypothetical protein n=1 Tax=Streptomyces sp. NPDC044984 TaxID=3154335 RepID=UPI00340F20FB